MAKAISVRELFRLYGPIVRGMFRYDPQSSSLTKSNGEPVELYDSRTGNLRVGIALDGRSCVLSVFQLVWYLHTGKVSELELCPRNEDHHDLRMANLVPRSVSQVQANLRKQRRQCTSQYKGVSWHKSTSAWRVQIYKSKRQYPLGEYADEDLAANVYNAAARQLFGEHARLNPCPPRQLPVDAARKVRDLSGPQNEATEPVVTPAA